MSLRVWPLIFSLSERPLIWWPYKNSISVYRNIFEEKIQKYFCKEIIKFAKTKTKVPTDKAVDLYGPPTCDYILSFFTYAPNDEHLQVQPVITGRINANTSSTTIKVTMENYWISTLIIIMTVGNTAYQGNVFGRADFPPSSSNIMNHHILETKWCQYKALQ